jgi:large subunit ribosomal protein L24
MKKGDIVIVIAGKEKGKKGVIARVLRAQDKVIIEGLNLLKKHMKPKKAGEKGSIVSVASPLHISNVKLEGGKAKEVKKDKQSKKIIKKEEKKEERA